MMNRSRCVVVVGAGGRVVAGRVTDGVALPGSSCSLPRPRNHVVPQTVYCIRDRCSSSILVYAAYRTSRVCTLYLGVISRETGE